MNINRLFFTSMIGLMISLYIQSQGYVNEIVNNTDSEIMVQSSDVDAKPCIIQSFSLTLGVEIQARIQKSFEYIMLQPKTRNIFQNLVLPKTNPTGHNQLIRITPQGKLYQKFPMSGCFIGVRQAGDLFGVAHWPYGINELNLFGVKFDGGNRCDNRLITTQEMVVDGANYSIEIQYRGGLVASIKKNDCVANMAQDTTKPLACIFEFNLPNNGDAIIKAVIGFDKFVSDVFFNRFLDVLKRNEFLSQVGKMQVEDNGKRLLKFDLYTRVTQEEFQKIIDTINKSV